MQWALSDWFKMLYKQRCRLSVIVSTTVFHTVERYNSAAETLPNNANITKNIGIPILVGYQYFALFFYLVFSHNFVVWQIN